MRGCSIAQKTLKCPKVCQFQHGCNVVKRVRTSARNIGGNDDDNDDDDDDDDGDLVFIFHSSTLE